MCVFYKNIILVVNDYFIFILSSIKNSVFFIKILF